MYRMGILFFSTSLLAQTIVIPITAPILPPPPLFPLYSISSVDIQKKGIHSLPHVLQNQSSIQLRDLFGDGSATEISLRGFGGNAPSNSLILIDGGDYSAPP